jgi:hypothetical protein
VHCLQAEKAMLFAQLKQVLAHEARMKAHKRTRDAALRKRAVADYLAKKERDKTALAVKRDDDTFRIKMAKGVCYNYRNKGLCGRGECLVTFICVISLVCVLQ